MTLAVGGSTAWVACKEQARIVRISLPAGRKTATVRLPGAVIAVALGYGSVWVLDDRSTLYRIDPRGARVMKQIPLGRPPRTTSGPEPARSGLQTIRAPRSCGSHPRRTR